MKNNYVGLDVLRGVGIFVVLMLHSAFYYFDGLYELDFNNPPPTVTVIGLLLMFAGLFAMISGMAHTIQFFRKTDEKGYGLASLMRYNAASGSIILSVAYLYFVLTGPGLVDMANKTMNNSILVEWIRHGNWIGLNLERLLYVDSLVMIGLNIFLMGFFYSAYRKIREKMGERVGPEFFLVSGIGVLVLSFLRIPLYGIYLDALEGNRYGWVLLLNWLVNKNNPIMPYLAFALLGMWLAAMMNQMTWGKMVRKILPVAGMLLTIGVVAYVKLPDTMLERSIDPKWFAIMMAQMGLFLLLVTGCVWRYDFRLKDEAKILGVIGRYFRRFGIAGLTPFFLESVFSAGVYRILRLFIPNLSFSMGFSLLYGLLLALFWGWLLSRWESVQYRYGLEYLYGRVLSGRGESAKAAKLEEVA